MLDRIGEADVLTWSQHVSLGVSHLGWTSSPGPPFACAVLGEANYAKEGLFFGLGVPCWHLPWLHRLQGQGRAQNHECKKVISKLQAGAFCRLGNFRAFLV